MLRKEYLETVRDRVIERGVPCADSHILECLKYLAIISQTSGRRIAVTPDVDEVWHELIVQTQSYHLLCAGLPGGKYLHHESITPAAYSERVGGNEFAAEFLRWVPDYVQSFGDFTPERARHWTVISFLTSEVGMSLAEINALGRESQADSVIDDDSAWRALAKDNLGLVTS